MRIISGIYKGRTLKSPSEKAEIRPTTDRARETLFNILANRLDFSKHTCADIFCGTGSFGLEFLSRGGKNCTFVDIDTKVIKENVTLLRITNDFKIIKHDSVKFLSGINDNEFSLIFADPPYKFLQYNKLLENVSLLQVLFILEHDKFFVVPADYSDKLFLQKKIGISFFSFFDFKKQI